MNIDLGSKTRFHFSDGKGYVVQRHKQIPTCSFKQDIEDVEPSSEDMLHRKPEFMFGNYDRIDAILSHTELNEEEYAEAVNSGIPTVNCIEDIAALEETSEVWGKPILLGMTLVHFDKCEVITPDGYPLYHTECGIMRFITLALVGHRHAYSFGRVYLYDKETKLPTCRVNVFDFERGDSKNWTYKCPGNFVKFNEASQCWDPIYAAIRTSGEVLFAEDEHLHCDVALYLTAEEYRALPKCPTLGAKWDFANSCWKDDRIPDVYRRKIKDDLVEEFGNLRINLNNEMGRLFGRTVFVEEEYVPIRDARCQLHHDFVRKANGVLNRIISRTFDHINNLSDDGVNFNLDHFKETFDDLVRDGYASRVKKHFLNSPEEVAFKNPVLERHLELFGGQEFIYHNTVLLAILDRFMDVVENCPVEVWATEFGFFDPTHHNYYITPMELTLLIPRETSELGSTQ